MNAKDLKNQENQETRIVIECHQSNLSDGRSYFAYDPKTVSIQQLRRMFDTLVFWEETGYADMEGNSLFFNLEDDSETRCIAESVIWS